MKVSALVHGDKHSQNIFGKRSKSLVALRLSYSHRPKRQ